MNKKGFKIDFLMDHTKEDILSEVKRVAKLLGRDTLTKKDIETHGKCSYGVINKNFGSLRVALEQANLKPT